MKKRLSSVLLCLCMVLTLLPISALATGEPATNVAKIGDTEYATLDAAVTAAQSGDTIVLTKDCSGSGIGTFASPGNDKIGVKNFTIDFGGYTYTCTGPAVGSSGTQSQAFHLEKGAAVTLKNGIINTVAKSGVKMLIQNYCNLTLDSMTLDGTELNNTSSYYTLSNNCGNVNIIGNTSIIAKAGGVAFDVYYWPVNSYTEGVNVTVNTTGTISGTIEYGSDDSDGAAAAMHDKAKLDIQKGNFVGNISAYCCNNNPNITITGGTFSTDPSAYVAVGYRATLSGSTYTVAKVPENKIVSASATVWNGEAQDTAAQALATVSGGLITVSGKLPAEDNKVVVTYTCTDGKTGTVTITLDESGITASPTSVTVGSTTYTVDVAGLSRLPATVKVAPPAAERVPTPILPDTASEDDNTAANEACKALNAGIPSDDGVQPTAAPAPVADGLAAAVADKTITGGDSASVKISPDATKPVETVISEEISKIGTPAENALQGIKDIAANTKLNPAVVVVIPVMEIKVTNAKVEEGKTSITLDISAFSQAVVTTKNIAADNIKTEGNSQNAVKVGDKVPVTVNTPVTIAIPIPDSLTKPLYVKHTHNGVTETVLATINRTGGRTYRAATFTVNGFSEMTLYSDSRSCTVNYSDGTSETITPAQTGSAGGYKLHVPTAPAGKSFVGWQFVDVAAYTGTYTHFTDKMLTDLGTPQVDSSAKTITATAVFADIPVGSSSYTLSFETNGGSKLDSITKSAGTVIDLATYKPTREGFNFGGWYSDKELTKIITSVTLSANTTVYAKWTKVLPFTDVPNDARIIE